MDSWRRCLCRRMLMLAGAGVVCIGLRADVAWPADFAEQVAANHHAPSGAQIASSAPVEVDGRAGATDVAATPLACVEGRSTSVEDSDAASVDLRKPTGLCLVFR